MNTSMVMIIVLAMLLLVSIIVGAKAYSGTHKKLEIEREERDKFERLFKFMGKWMEAEENGASVADKIKAMDKDIVILGDNPIAQVMKSKLDKAGVSYRAETEVEACKGAEIVLVSDISRFAKWEKKLDKLGIKSVSIEDVFYGEEN
ncbi:hypothetical protein [Butyrivibrio sp. VCB2006]|uniref:hypothetical protein n=1 Tax=Butyrivibrio sp. VCB2006 TaxID=1280679 RepID=UPI0004243EAE|nr:hypothetical protein [Butyrivibrio sp. VCB2006]